jgi:hypothetical protein
MRLCLVPAVASESGCFRAQFPAFPAFRVAVEEVLVRSCLAENCLAGDCLADRVRLTTDSDSAVSRKRREYGAHRCAGSSGTRGGALLH